MIESGASTEGEHGLDGLASELVSPTSVQEPPISPVPNPPAPAGMSLLEELRRRIALKTASSICSALSAVAKPGGKTSGRMAHPKPAIDFTWARELRNDQAAAFKEELLRQLDMRPPGERIRPLRTVLGWTQRRAAVELRISMRTVIRHEQGHHRTRWPRLPLLHRLRELERTYAGQITAYLDSGEPARA